MAEEMDVVDPEKMACTDRVASESPEVALSKKCAEAEISKKNQGFG